MTDILPPYRGIRESLDQGQQSPKDGDDSAHRLDALSPRASCQFGRRELDPQIAPRY